MGHQSRPALEALLLLAASLLSAAAWPAENWIETSNAHAQDMLAGIARFNPEFAGSVGYDGVDEEIADLGPELAGRFAAYLESSLAELRARLARTEHPKVRQDLEIMIAGRARQLETVRLNDALMLPYFNPARTVFFGISGLLDPQVPASRKPAAMVRLARYAGREDGYTPLAELARQRTEERFSRDGLLGPYRPEVEQDLASRAQYLGGIRQLLAASELEGWEDDLAALESQLGAYDDWVRAEILPRARDDFRLPAALYALSLQQFGVDASPEALIREATAGFAEIRNEMIALAPLVARDLGIEATDYRHVIRALKEKTFEPDGILPAYLAINDTLEEIITREGIVTLPERDVVLRFKTPAEQAAVPSPSLKPPRLVGNTGEVPEFLLPRLEPDAPANDFTFTAAAWTLAAHEMRPGHELQFSRMLEAGVSDVRALFAFNSVNVEGWALYAEAEAKPYLPLDGQLIGLQQRLLRAARAFLDPMLNTGMIGTEEARRVLLEDVMLEPRFAGHEIDRYTFRAPGQAASYYYGYRKLMALRTEAELAQGAAFDRRAFHDFILDQGLLPPDLLARAVREEFLASGARAAAGRQGALR